jgi:hypothetical protein
MKLPYVEGADREYYRQTGGILIHTKTVGVTFDGRQSVIASMPKHSHVTLAWDKENTHDDTAIGVYCNGDSVGYLKKELAVVLFPYVKNYKQDVTAEVTGGDAGNNYGVNLTIRFFPDSTDPAPASEYIQKDKSHKKKTNWILIIIGIQFSANVIRYGMGYKSFPDLIGHSITYGVWLICALLIHKLVKNKMGAFWSTLISLILGYFIMFVVLFFLFGSMPITSSVFLPKLNTEHIPYASNITLPIQTNTKTTQNYDKTSTPYRANTRIPTPTEKYKSVYIDGKQYYCYPTATPIPYPTPIMKKDGYTEAELKFYGYIPDKTGNYIGLYKADNGNFFFTGKRRPLIHIDDPRTYSTYSCYIADFYNIGENTTVYSNISDSLGYEVYSYHVVTLSPEDRLRSEIEYLCREP